MSDQEPTASSIRELYEASWILMERIYSEMRLPKDKGYDVGADAVRVLRETLSRSKWAEFTPDPKGNFSSWLAMTKPIEIEEFGNAVLRDLTRNCARKREHEAASERAVKQEAAALERGEPQALDAILRRFEPRVSRFLEIAARKVLQVDDYGDENWEALDSELARLLQKETFGIMAFASPEVLDLVRTGNYQKLPRAANALVLRLREEVKAYCSRRKSLLVSTGIDRMSGQDFEMFIAEKLKEAGATEVRRTPATGDQGADILFSIERRRVAAQAKRYSAPVGNAAVQEVHAAVGFYGCHEGWVMTNATFTRSATELATRLGVVLVDGARLATLAELLSQQD